MPTRVGINWPYPEIPVPGAAVTMDGRKVGEVISVTDTAPPTVTVEVTDPDAVTAVTADLADLGIGLGDAR